MDVIAIQMLYLRAMESLRTLRDEEAGQGLVEYSLILALVAVAAIATLGAIGTNVDDVLTTVKEGLEGVVPV